MRILKAAVCATAALVFFATAAPARAQGPRYLDALRDLRTARDYIQFDNRPAYDKQRHHAVDEINKAIDEIKHAAWDDGKNTQFAPPDKGVQNPWQPMRMADEFLRNAGVDVRSGMDQPQNQGLRERANQHIEEARHTIDMILQVLGH